MPAPTVSGAISFKHPASTLERSSVRLSASSAAYMGPASTSSICVAMAYSVGYLLLF